MNNSNLVVAQLVIVAVLVIYVFIRIIKRQVGETKELKILSFLANFIWISGFIVGIEAIGDNGSPAIVFVIAGVAPIAFILYILYLTEFFRKRKFVDKVDKVMFSVSLLIFGTLIMMAFLYFLPLIIIFVIIVIILIILAIFHFMKYIVKLLLK
jgi:hypothetical protein